MEVCLWLITSDRVFNPKQEYIMPVVRVSWFEGKEHAQKA
ncbi:4-oxalocrotonate tautomerase, partial [Pseudomonas syringae]|nr:4-oxalocrotonate tautomerase [Pseudomonas syringae]